MAGVARRYYLLINTPVELVRPYVMHMTRQTPRTDKLFKDYMMKVEEARKQGSQTYLMSKQDVQKWTAFFPAGLRVQALSLEIRPSDLE
jgi:hypothetical protein